MEPTGTSAFDTTVTSERSRHTHFRWSNIRWKTAAAIGFEPAQATIPNTDSLAAVATTSGFQAMHLAGMDGMWPSLKGSADDSMENIDEELLLENIDYLTELAQRF